MSETKAKVTPEKRSWINQALGKLGRTPSAAPPARPRDDAPAFVQSAIYAPKADDEGSSSSDRRGAAALSKARRRDLNAQLLGTDEDVGRRRTAFGVTVGTSGDKGFKQNVQAQVAGFAQRNTGVLDGSAPLDRARIADAFAVRGALAAERVGYAGRKTGEKNQAKRDQRDRKAGAIGDRVDALDTLMETSPAAIAEWMMPEPDDTLRFVKGEDGKAAFAALAKTVVAGCGSDDDYMSDLLTDLADRQIQDETKGDGGFSGTLLRGTSEFSSLMSIYMKESKPGREFRKAYQTRIAAALPAGSLEIDEFKTEQKDAIARNQQSLARLAGDVLDRTIGCALPGPVVASAVKLVQELRGQGVTSDRELAIAVGGIVMLRVINPAIVDILTVPELKLNGDQKRTVILVQKALQNLSNGMAAKDTTGKEPYMTEVMNALARREGDMFRWLLEIVEEAG